MFACHKCIHNPMMTAYLSEYTTNSKMNDSNVRLNAHTTKSTFPRIIKKKCDTPQYIYKAFTELLRSSTHTVATEQAVSHATYEKQYCRNIKETLKKIPSLINSSQIHTSSCDQSQEHSSIDEVKTLCSDFTKLRIQKANSLKSYQEPLKRSVQDIAHPKSQNACRKYTTHYSTPGSHTLKTVILKAIESARKSITLFIYSLNDQEILNALEKRALAGLSVTVFVDNISKDISKNSTNTTLTITKLANRRLMHLKVLVTDNTLYFGSANFTHKSLQQSYNLISQFTSKRISSLFQQKAIAFLTKDHLPCPTREVFCFNKNGKELEFIFLPFDKEIENSLHSLIKSAEKTIKIAMSKWTHEDLAKAVIKRYKDGIDIEVILDGKHCMEEQDGSQVSMLLQQAKIPVHYYPSNTSALMHHKFALIDTVFVQGSANWSKSGFSKNHEFVSIFKGLSKKDIAFVYEMWSTLCQDIKKIQYSRNLDRL